MMMKPPTPVSTMLRKSTTVNILFSLRIDPGKKSIITMRRPLREWKRSACFSSSLFDSTCGGYPLTPRIVAQDDRAVFLLYDPLSGPGLWGTDGTPAGSCRISTESTADAIGMAKSGDDGQQGEVQGDCVGAHRRTLHSAGWLIWWARRDSNP